MLVWTHVDAQMQKAGDPGALWRCSICILRPGRIQVSHQTVHYPVLLSVCLTNSPHDSPPQFIPVIHSCDSVLRFTFAILTIHQRDSPPHSLWFESNFRWKVNGVLSLDALAVFTKLPGLGSILASLPWTTMLHALCILNGDKKVDAKRLININ